MPSEAVETIRAAAADGQPGAVAYSAVLAAEGIEEPQDWAVALDRLAKAAELGSAHARGQLRVLSGEGTAQGGWAKLAAAVDIAAWTAPQPTQSLHEGGRVQSATGFLPPIACGWLIHRAKDRLARATVYAAESGLHEDEQRTNSMFEFGMDDLDVVVVAVRARIAATLDVAGAVLEPLQVLHYAPGQVFRPHYDFLHEDLPGQAELLAGRGQRLVTFLIYLNDGYEGGETEFPLLDLKYRGGRGDALAFANLDARGQPDRRMLHAGLAPTTGEKWLATQWLRRPPAPKDQARPG